jgi:hypothetical protein
MTLVLTRASKDYVLQVTDRLLTTAGGQPFDATSNKNVLYFSRNAAVALGYTGLAYLDGIPTDQWMVETLTGHRFERGRKPPAISPTPISARDIGQSIARLKRGLERAPVESKWASYWRTSSFDVCVSGWQWSRKRARPVVAWLSKPENGVAIELGNKPRHWHWDRDPKKRFKVQVVAAPASNLPGAQLKAMAEQLANCDPDKAERVMVEAIHEISRSVPEVGPHCMSILIGPPSTASIRIRYIPVGGPALAVMATARGPALTVPAAFTPWLVSPGAIFAPSINAGVSEVRIGTYTITLEAPKSSGSGILGLLSSQQRPKLP